MRAPAVVTPAALRIGSRRGVRVSARRVAWRTELRRLVGLHDLTAQGNSYVIFDPAKPQAEEVAAIKGVR